jgi:hypothetical protein
MSSATQVLAHLETSEFTQLIGTVEDQCLDAKKAPYTLSDNRQKQELAKDVSAMANAGGGVLLLGFRTARNPLAAGDQIADVCSFSQDLPDADQYRKVLAEWVYPPLENVEIRRFTEPTDPTDPRKAVAAIVVDPAKVSSGRPYLVAKSVDEADRVTGILFAYFERRLDRASTTAVARLQHLLAAGQEFDAIEHRLLSIENAIRTLGESGTLVRKGGGSGISEEVRKQRPQEARRVVERDELPILYFTAAA